MCGIAALFAYHYASPEVDRDELRLVRDAMTHRGPDGYGEWFSSDGRVALGHRRLSILDLSTNGAQPMVSSNKKIVISFNGEIYNFREIRAKLESIGYVFKSGTDTEVLLYLYQDQGEKMFESLRGMYAFALWDSEEKKMLLARDPFGIKPLYYADDGWCLRVASEVKALLECNKVSKLPEPAGIAGFFLMGSIPEPFTSYQEIRSVPAGTFLWVNSVGAQPPTKFFSIPETLRNAWKEGLDFHGSEESVMREVINDSVKHHFVSDVPVGVFLSAGIDSGVLTAYASERGDANLKTLTLAFSEFRGTPQDESVLAEELAKIYKTQHQTHILSLKDAQQCLPDFIAKMDQPTIDGLNTYLVSKFAAQAGLKVVLSGLGSDELFGGYPTFKDVPSWTQTFGAFRHAPLIGKVMRKGLVAINPGLKKSPKIAGMFEYGGTYECAYLLKRGLFMPWEVGSLVGEEIAREGLKRLRLIDRLKSSLDPDPGSAMGRVSSLEMSFYMRNQLLRDADWAGMSQSLEIRVPFVDRLVMEKLAFLHGVRSQKSWKRVLARTPKTPLPDAISDRKKTGFSLPMDRWIQADGYDVWKEKSALAREGCHWSRRWAYTIYKKCVNV